jgi:4a-hydroxytetrahydrobiopterin dehydratase
MHALSDEEIAQSIKQLSGWKLTGGELHKSFTFPDFTHAFQFMTDVAREADRLNHHPDWSNSFNKVDITLKTHAAHGLTHYDFQLAQFIDTLLQNSS